MYIILENCEVELYHLRWIFYVV